MANGRVKTENSVRSFIDNSTDNNNNNTTTAAATTTIKHTTHIPIKKWFKTLPLSYVMVYHSYEMRWQLALTMVFVNIVRHSDNGGNVINDNVTVNYRVAINKEG